MKNVKLGKKNDFERGSFMAYACNCMSILCKKCTNCSSYKKNDAEGSYATSFVTNSKISNQSSLVGSLF